MPSTELLELCRTNRYDTDKFKTDNTVTTWITVKHSYVENAYGELFKRIRNAKNVLEIGIHNGGSHLLWRDYFPDATVVGIDIKLCEQIKEEERIFQVIGNAYCEECLKVLNDGKFELIIDDGPHTLDSMKYVVEKYLPSLTENGIMCIEDIEGYSWVEELTKLVPEELKQCIKIFDLREEDQKSDSILMVIDKGELNG